MTPTGFVAAAGLTLAGAALHGGTGAPVWLLQAVAGCARAADGIDALTATLARRLG